MAKHKLTMACEIPNEVKWKVWERDGMSCLWCGKRGDPWCHYIPRSQGGLGIEENILTLCCECHFKYDHTPNRQKMKAFFKGYLEGKYDNWSEDKLIYRKGANNE